MIWRDLLYFSSGEKRALLVLVVLLILAMLALRYCESKHDLIECETNQLNHSSLAADSVFSVSKKEDKQPEWGKKKQLVLSEQQKQPVASTHSSASLSKQKARFSSVKYPEGTVLDLNDADTLQLRKIPGIGDVFASRIVKFRRLLGGFYSVEQLKEVYGITQERYIQLLPWFTADSTRINKLLVNTLPKETLQKHPYLNYKQVRIMNQLRMQKGKLSGWHDLALLEEFSDMDRIRLYPYLSFD